MSESKSGADKLTKAQVAGWSNRELAVALKFLAMERGASGENDSAVVVLEAANRLSSASSTSNQE
jgi:hypothetical protein